MPSPSKREQIIDTALSLFYQHGFTATGIDKIVATSGITKKTIYAYFTSKDELILAVLRKRDELFRDNFIRNVERFGKTPPQKLYALFDALHEWFNSPQFFGCMFINAAAEYTPQDHPFHLVCAEHKRLMSDYVHTLATQAGAHEPRALTEQLNYLIEGAIVHAHVCGDKTAALKAKAMAQIFIGNALTKAILT